VGKLFVAILVNYGFCFGWGGGGGQYELAGDIIASLLSDRVFGAGGGHLVSIVLQLNIEAALMLRDVTAATLPKLICHGLSYVYETNSDRFR
jgi:hypothetical protein